jgi:hypothetical protein
MSNEQETTGRSLRGLRKTRSRALTVVFAFFTTTFFISETKKILSSPHDLADYFYLALLLCLALKVGTWILISEKELDFLDYWLDPKLYEPPSEMSTIFAIAITLSALILTARYLVLFGVCYVLYAIGNLYGWWRLRNELHVAIPKTMERLAEESPSIAAIHRDALDVISDYYLKPPHVLRSSFILVASVFTLCLAGYAYRHGGQSAQIATYCVCIFDIVFIEEASIAYYRAKFYSATRPVTAAERERKRQTNTGTEPMPSH